MKVVEIFSSIQGEGPFIGLPMTFVRLYGCNLACPWCDTKYANEGGIFKEITPYTMYEEIKKLGNKHVCFTGGEPLMQYRELNGLLTRLEGTYTTHIETNGTILPGKGFNYIDYWSISPKLPHTKPETVKKLLDFVDMDAWIKFVVSSSADVRAILQFMISFPSDIDVVIQPERYAASVVPYPNMKVPGKSEKWVDVAFHKSNYLESLKNIVAMCQVHLADAPFEWRVLPQLHYLIWGDKRGI